MKVLIVSDTHGRDSNLELVLKKVSPIDLLIHLGDFEGSDGYIKSIANCDVEFVAGNNDYFDGFPREKIIQIGKYTVLLTHGHRYGVNYGTERIKGTAVLNHAGIVMYGHTHIPLIDVTGNVYLINPGSLSLPRQYGRIPTYIIMDLDSKGDAHFTLNHLKER